MNIAERIAKHRRMAEAYRDAYLRKDVHGGQSYGEWKFSEDAVYASPYFTGDEVYPMSAFSLSAGQSATNEAAAYALKFPDWAPVDFRYWPAENGFVMKTRWEGHMQDGTRMGFYSYGFVETNDLGEVTRWETHVNDEYGDFLEVAIGIRGPFHGTTEYNEAVARTLREAGVAQ